jgi:hypothetical protein
VVGILIWSYLGGVLVATVGAYAASRRLTDRRSPSAHPLVLSVVAGLMWPLLLVGLVELSSVMLYTKVHAKPTTELGVYA